mgnify:CR=1 FL=1
MNTHNETQTETTVKERQYIPLPGLGRYISKELNKDVVELDVHATNYLSGTLTAEDTRGIKAAFERYIFSGAEGAEGADVDIPDMHVIERALASDVLKADESFHVTLLFPSEKNVAQFRRAAEVVGGEVPPDYADLSKKKRAQVHGEVMRALRAREPRVQMTFGDNAFVTKDGVLAAVEMRFVPPSSSPSSSASASASASPARSAPSIYETIDPDKVFHVTLIHDRDVEERAPSFSNQFLEQNK